MSNYSTNPASCRVDFFKPTGKWYETEEVIFNQYSREYGIHDAFRDALTKSIKNRYKGMTAVCLEPYHALSHPISLVV